MALIGFSVLVGLLIAEFLIRQFTHFPIHAPISNRITDERLLFRTSPSVREVDQNGFRNPPGYDTPFPRIAAIGDSQTYGYNVRREASWPAQLERLIGERVYNLGVGNYSYLNLVAAAERALEFGAKTLLVGLHPINDLEICRTAKLRYWTERLRDADGGAEILRRCRIGDDFEPQTPYEILNAARGRGLYRQLKDRSAVLSLLRYVRESLFGLRDNLGRVRSEQCISHEDDFVFQAGALKDLVPHYAFGTSPKVRAVDPTIVRYTLREISKAAREKGAKLKFLIIPGRPRVVVEYLRHAGRLSEAPDWVLTAASYEGTQIAYATAAAEELAIPWADATSETVAAYRRVTGAGNTFFPCSDSHPLAEGYAAYARVARTLLLTR